MLANATPGMFSMQVSQHSHMTALHTDSCKCQMSGQLHSPEGSCVKQVHARQEPAEAHVHLVCGHVRRVGGLQRPSLMRYQRLQVVSLHTSQMNRLAVYARQRMLRGITDSTEAVWHYVMIEKHMLHGGKFSRQLLV